MKSSMKAGLALALAVPLCAAAQSPVPGSEGTDELSMLKQEIRAMRADYEARLQALEMRLLQAGKPQAVAAVSPPMADVAASAASAATGPSNAIAPDTASSAGANGFNPGVSLVLSGLYARTSRDPASYAIAGFPLPTNAGAGPGTRGFSLAESELGLAANIDPWWRGAANISFHPDDTVSVEEAFVQTTALGSGLSLKAGRFFSGVGYLNSQHSHTWDFVDAPLAYQSMLGGQFNDDGVQLTWLAPTDQFVELGVELGRGRRYPGTDTGRNGAGSSAFTLHTGGDIGDSHSWRAGVSVLNAQATNQSLQAVDAFGNTVSNAFTGNTRVWVVDGVWKWAPNGNATQTNFKLQGEYLRSTRNGNLTYDVTGANVSDGARLTQSGWYLQAVYQFMPAWRVGLRTERLDAGAPDYGINTAALGAVGYQPHKNSVMLDYSPSEFSRWRLQLAQDRARVGSPDNQVFVQYQMSLGAHGAHSY